ncbi:hypothetical protein CEUSTIGMA_g4470.t1 [Chlamydomonas eustigma]|uniref:peptidylprolyl isomerase n=1 Tax=Chlamydomonas eustigma TaxID=1157962 RepID=A0A250X1Q9_9CHLO|nr:hypothetical protein CEUSTIGMA_g4470.t1 [Chlamydomonas eustigma]|eukprot:GAX77023.1 hypothetical protein CEUSTIGMA_g4470.t1 [Chlamydomonas eustigma]
MGQGICRASSQDANSVRRDHAVPVCGWVCEMQHKPGLPGDAGALLTGAQDYMPTPDERTSISSSTNMDGLMADTHVLQNARLQTETFTKVILKSGEGPRPQPHQYVTVQADLYISDKSRSKGTPIWSTEKSRGFLFPAPESGPQPFTYQAGVGSVVKGWEDGVASMATGEMAELYLPWEYAYGAGGHPGFKIPPESDLVFVITVLSISSEKTQ